MIQLAQTGVLIARDGKSDADKTAYPETVDAIRHQIHNDPRLVATELGHATGLLLATRLYS